VAFGRQFEVVDMKTVHHNPIFRAEVARHPFTIQSQGNYTQKMVSEQGLKSTKHQEFKSHRQTSRNTRKREIFHEVLNRCIRFCKPALFP
jgi:hypothetical protein